MILLHSHELTQDMQTTIGTIIVIHIIYALSWVYSGVRYYNNRNVKESIFKYERGTDGLNFFDFAIFACWALALLLSGLITAGKIIGNLL